MMSEKMPEPQAHEEAIAINEEMETLRAKLIHAREGLGFLVERVQNFNKDYEGVRMNASAKEKFFDMLQSDVEEMEKAMDKAETDYNNFIKTEIKR